MTEDTRKIISNCIQQLLARREHSKVELARKLHSKGFDAQLCAEMIERYAVENVQSDMRFAEMLVRSKVSKGQGVERIRNELREHQIDQQAIQLALQSSEQELQLDWFELAKQVRQKKFGQSVPQDWQQKQKQQRFLQYRGFTLEQIDYALQKD